jgi:hypothetical protein
MYQAKATQQRLVVLDSWPGSDSPCCKSQVLMGQLVLQVIDSGYAMAHCMDVEN